MDAAKAIITHEQQFSQRARAGGFFLNDAHKKQLQQIASQVGDGELRELLCKGVGFHTAKLEYKDRRAVEDLFRSGGLLVLCTTTTLSQGVNLPAHLVIVKSTQGYRQKLGYVEYDRSTIMQMVGRAGRPQFDSSGVAVIMTQQSMVTHYEQMPNTQVPLESNLLGSMVEHINAEISLQTISNITDAVEWIKSTFLYVRMKRNPSHYGAAKSTNPTILENKLKELCLTEIDRLTSHGLVESDELAMLKPTTLGKLLAKYCIFFIPT